MALRNHAIDNVDNATEHETDLASTFMTNLDSSGVSLKEKTPFTPVILIKHQRPDPEVEALKKLLTNIELAS